MQINQPIKPPVATQAGKGEHCDWSNCQDDHPAALNYPNNGVVTRGGGFRDALANIGLQPWLNGNHGEPSKPIYVKSGKIKRNADGTVFTDYRWEAHHLIPIEQMDKMGTLKSNAVLSGWNINHEINGMGLPADKPDIAIHRLQLHNGSHHGRYTKPITDKLTVIEDDFEDMCHGKTDTSLQLTLILELNALSRTAEQKIVAIRQQKAASCWELHSTSLADYKWSVAEHARRKRRHDRLPPDQR